MSTQLIVSAWYQRHSLERARVEILKKQGTEQEYQQLLPLDGSQQLRLAIT